MNKLITVWRSGAIGDFVLTLPALTALKKFGQGTPIRVVAQPATSPLFEADISINSNSNDLAPLYSPDLLPHPFFDQSSLLLVYGKPEGPLLKKLACTWVIKPYSGILCHLKRAGTISQITC